MPHRIALVVAGLLTVLSAPAPVPLPTAWAAPACGVTEGVGIAGAQVGKAVEAAIAVTGPPLRQRTEGSQIIYDLREPWAYLVAEHGIVRRIATRSPSCRTAGGVGPGSTAADVRAAYATSAVSSLRPVPDGQVLMYPIEGVSFLIRDNQRVEVVEVFRGTAVGRPAATPPGPVRGTPGTPAPTTAPGTWRVSDARGQVQGTTLIVTGTVENRSRGAAAYAEIVALADGGRPVGQGETFLRPNPVPAGGSASFEARIAVSEVPRRFTITIRPMGMLNVALARFSGELRDVGQLGGVVAQQLRVQVQSTTPVPGPQNFVVTVTNTSPVPVTAARVAVRIDATCRIPTSFPAVDRVLVAAAAPIPTPTPRTIQETWNGIAPVGQLRPGASAQIPLQLSGGVCLFFTTWSASTQVSDVKVEEEKR